MKYRIRICQGVSCQDFLSEDLFKHAQKLAADYPEITVEKRGCMCRCERAPNFEVIDESTGKSEILKRMDYVKLEQLIKELAKS